jgi:antimicrobial peptide system SdpB family protein
MFTRLGIQILETHQTKIWSVMLGVARSLLALATGLTLLFTDTQTLFLGNSSLVDKSLCSGIDAANLFCLVPTASMNLAHILALGILVLVTSGWRPRLTGIFHWWVAWSYHQAGTFVDGGDQVIMILTLLLVPVTLTDPRVWHWQRAATEDHDLERPIARLVALGWLSLIRLQVAVIYFHAATAKFAVPEWLNGTAVYYWFGSATLGMPAWLQPILDPLLNSAACVLAITWGTMLLEILLVLGLLAEPGYRRPLLKLGLIFHAGIAVVFSLSSFMLAMDAALLLYLGDPNWKLPKLPRRSRKIVRVSTVSLVMPLHDQPQTLPAELVFDGRCGFCTRVVHAIKRLDRHNRLRIVAWQEPNILERNGLSLQDVHDAAWLVVGNSRLRGAAAINAALTLTTGNGLAWWFYSLPGIQQFQNFIYAWVANHRRLFRGTTPHCREPMVECSATD